MSGYDRLHGYVFFSCSSGVFADDADADARKRLADKVGRQYSNAAANAQLIEREVAKY